MTTDAPRRDLAPSSAAGARDDSMRWERLFINEIKTLKAGSKDQLESLTELASNDASKRYKSIVNIVSKYAQVMKPKYRPSLMYVISSLIMHENPKVSSLYRQRFAINFSFGGKDMRVSIGTVGNGAKEHRAMAREGMFGELGFG